MSKGTVYLVDDDRDLLASAKDWMEVNEFEVIAFVSAIDLLKGLEDRVPDIIVSDIRMPSIDGMTLLATVKKTHPHLPVILLTGHGEVQLAVQAIKSGAEDFLEKPYDADHLISVLEKALRRSAMSSEIGRLQKIVHSKSKLEPAILGHHPTIKRLNDQITVVSQIDVDVLIIGETGTGKELVANTIHEKSKRSARPFVAINCAAISDVNFESELFGHVKGSFSGADRDRAGKFEYAMGGTVFLDEIESMPIAMQAKILRVVQERKIERLGENRSRSIDVRILSSSKSDLLEAISDKRFREDLYYRLSASKIVVPPLRQRENDILYLYNHFGHLAASRYGHPTFEASAELAFELMTEHWPGNVRELKARAESHALGLNWGERTESVATNSNVGNLTDEMREFEKAVIQRALLSTENNVAKAAKILGIPRRTLSEKISRLKI